MSGELRELQNRPIPDQSLLREALHGRRDWRIDVNDFKNQEPCLDARKEGIAGENLYYAGKAPYYESFPGSIPELYLRTSVIEKLHTINERLHSADLEIFIHDAWRPTSAQAYGRDVWFPARLRAQYPEWSDEEIMEEVNRYWAPGPATDAQIDPLSPPPHATGGVTDLTIRRKNGEHLWMGTIMDDVTRRAHLDALEESSELSLSDDEARMNRRLLYWVMTEAGCTVHPREWWHVCYGDQMWAKLTSLQEGKDRPAFYSNIDPR